MNVPPEKKESVRRWMIAAQHDLKNAEHTLKLSDTECPFDTCCFHAQQCAEKSLKALLILHGIRFEKIHDLKRLLDLCAPHSDLVRKFKGIDFLTPYAVETRYPEFELWEEINRSEAEKAVKLARKVHKAVQRKLVKVFA